jgi:hypothetical protein
MIAVVGLLAYKFVLARLLNVNWDEFYFLSHIYELDRGQLTLLLLGAYTHLFSWLPRVDGGEIAQIIVARQQMTVLLVVNAWLIWRLGRRWLSGFAAVIPPFVYLSAIPVMIHGGSFRNDSLLAPLSTGALLLLTTPNRNHRNEWGAGILCGLAFAITVKAVLFAPLFLALIWFTRTQSHTSHPKVRAGFVYSVGRVGVAAIACAAVIVGLHSLAVVPAPDDSLGMLATAMAKKTVVDTPWFPRLEFLTTYIRWQPLPWLLILLGFVTALLRRRFDIASLMLALLPLAFYRNAYPYYYVVMLAPTSCLVGYAMKEIADVVAQHRGRQLALTALAVVWVGLLYQGLTHINRLYVDGQVEQRMVLAGVHQIFPMPVNYVDRCGMVSSFRKVNFFMSTWGLESYRAAGTPFMPNAIRTQQPAMLLVNTPVLHPGARFALGLLPEDQTLVERFYPKYWGPVRVAGGRADLRDESSRLLVPYAAEYRLRATVPVLIDGIPRKSGDVLSLTPEGAIVQAQGPLAPDVDPIVHVFLASARPAPARDLPEVASFAGL